MALRAFFDNLSLPELGASLQQRYAASAQKQALASLSTSLLLQEDLLINTVSGESRRLVQEGNHWFEQLAQTARLLLPESRHATAILLLLPSSAFVATRFDLNIKGEKMLKSALRLQAPSLLPAYERPLQLALNGQLSQGIALWYPQDDLNALYQAFGAAGLKLGALLPRVLGAMDSTIDSSGCLLDEDAGHTTLVELEAGVVKTWLCVHHQDLEQELFRQQWQAERQRIESLPIQTLQLNRNYWDGLRRQLAPLEAYCFFPTGAIESGKSILARKQKIAGAFAVAALVLLLILPFVTQRVQIAWLEHQVANLQEQSEEARQSQAAVLELEDSWGAVAEFPQQDTGAILLALNQYIEGTLSSFTLNKGVVDISGYAQDPALLIEQLAELELFYDVGQSRSSSGGNNASRGDRFGIRMNVSGVDFPAYESAYPASQQ